MSYPTHLFTDWAKKNGQPFTDKNGKTVYLVVGKGLKNAKTLAAIAAKIDAASNGVKP